MRETQISCGLTFSFIFQVWILYHLESPYHTYPVEPKDVFNWTATYRQDSDIPTPYFRWVYYEESVKQNNKLDHNYAANKTKKASCCITLLLLNYQITHLSSPVCNSATFWKLQRCYVWWLYLAYECLKIVDIVTNHHPPEFTVLLLDFDVSLLSPGYKFEPRRIFRFGL